MRNRFLLTLFCVLVWAGEVQSENEYEVKKKGVFPFMAILYYPDETVVDASGNRFLHAAVLFKPDWLLSGAIDHSVLDNVPLGFPRKTLLARMGALTFDDSFTLNEDDDEQEREVIRIVKPRNHNKDSWWTTDITLLQTLLPFKLTLVVAPTAINPKRTYVDNNCAILFYTKKYGSTTDVKFLMQLGVELMPASTENCGAHFSAATMTCASHDPADDMKSVYDLEFCPGNSGGPLLCEGEVMALQTYIENNCKQPHLYQLLAPWDTLIKCALEQKCNANDNVCNICTSTHKDDPSVNTLLNNTQLHTGEVNLGSSKIPETFIVENNTSSRSELLSTTPTVLEANYSTVSYLKKSDELEQTISSLSNESKALAPELSSTSEKNQSSSSKLSEVLIGTTQKMESPGLENQTVPQTSIITVPTHTTVSWLETAQDESQQRLMGFSDNENTTVTVKDELPTSTKQTTKIKKWSKKKPKDKGKPAARLRDHNNQTKRIKAGKKNRHNKEEQQRNETEGSVREPNVVAVNETEGSNREPNVEAINGTDGSKREPNVVALNETEGSKREPNVVALRSSERVSLVSVSNSGAGKKDIITPLILPLITLVFLI